jgi:hypothetical protein
VNLEKNYPLIERLWRFMERIEKSDLKKDTRDNPKSADLKSKEKPGKHASGASNTHASRSSKLSDIKDVECYHCHKKGHYANKCPDLKARDTKGVFKVRKVEKGVEAKEDEAMLSQIRIAFLISKKTRLLLSFVIGSYFSIVLENLALWKMRVIQYGFLLILGPM